jgi:hypothetical protein
MDNCPGELIPPQTIIYLGDQELIIITKGALDIHQEKVG